MGSRGPAPKPKKIHQAQGTYRKDRHGDAAEIEFTTGIPVCPKWLTTPGKIEWKRVVAELEKIPGVLQKVDWAQFAVYCEAWGEFAELMERTKGKSTLWLVKHRLANYKRKLVADISRLGQQFGFTPVSRSRVTVPTNANGETAKAGSLEDKYFNGPRIAKTG